jgi:hypothetical protein
LTSWLFSSDTSGGVPYGTTWEELGYTQRRELKGKEISLLKEINYIVNCAQAHETRIVSWKPLLFFSTDLGDAWALDPEDHLALCLARDGVRQPIKFLETEHNFGIQ